MQRPLRRAVGVVPDEVHAEGRGPLGHENLKIIGRAGVTVDNIDIDAASERGMARALLANRCSPRTRP